MTAATRGDEAAALRELASAAGVLTAYEGIGGTRREASDDALVAVLRALGHPLESVREAPEALRTFQHELAAGHESHHVVVWGDAPIVVMPRPAEVQGIGPDSPVDCQITVEHGEIRHRRARVEPGRNGSPLRCIVDRHELPFGVHRLCLTINTRIIERAVLVAPQQCYRSHEVPVRGAGTSTPSDRRPAGVFLPTYAIRSARNWGIGDLTDLRDLAEWTASAGGGSPMYVGTLPLLACFLDEPFEPSPYSPITRLFWNEVFLDLTASPDVQRSETARQRMASDPFRREVASLREREHVDYRRVAALKREVLADLADAAFADEQRRDELERYIAGREGLSTFAAFRAAVDRHRNAWQAWPERQRDGDLREGDYDPADWRRHVYAQWLFDREMDQLRHGGADARSSSPSSRPLAGLYLDLPLGVNGGGFDVWRYREQFGTGMTVGAPPDPFFTGGQNWGFPPLDPRATARTGHDYFRRAIRNHLRHASVLRLDHVMALHRLFWIPEGFDAKEGVYVRYPHEALYAILAIESHRHRSIIVGENLGTVPAEVNESMARRGVLRMAVAQFAVSDDADRAVPSAQADELACVNTHDMPPFAGWWRGVDVELREQLGWFGRNDEAQAERQARRRHRAAVVDHLHRRGRLAEVDPESADPIEIHGALAELFADGEADTFLVTLEDLWGETRPQNVPGTTEAYPNWQRKAAKSLDALRADDVLFASLRRLAHRGTSPSPAPARLRSPD